MPGFERRDASWDEPGRDGLGREKAGRKLGREGDGERGGKGRGTDRRDAKGGRGGAAGRDERCWESNAPGKRWEVAAGPGERLRTQTRDESAIKVATAPLLRRFCRCLRLSVEVEKFRKTSAWA